MLWAPSKLGVLNPAGASVGAPTGGGASAPANRATEAIKVAARQEETRILFNWGTPEPMNTAAPPIARAARVMATTRPVFAAFFKRLLNDNRSDHARMNRAGRLQKSPRPLGEGTSV